MRYPGVHVERFQGIRSQSPDWIWCLRPSYLRMMYVVPKSKIKVDQHKFFRHDVSGPYGLASNQSDEVPEA